MNNSLERIIRNLMSDYETPLIISKNELSSVRFCVEDYKEQFKRLIEEGGEWFRCHWAILTFLDAVIGVELPLYEFELDYIIAQAHSKHLLLQEIAIDMLESLDDPNFLEKIEDVKVPNYYIQKQLDEMKKDWRERLNG